MHSALLLFYSCAPVVLGNDSGVAFAPGVEPVLLSIQVNSAGFCTPSCEPFVRAITLPSLLETHEAQLG